MTHRALALTAIATFLAALAPLGAQAQGFKPLQAQAVTSPKVGADRPQQADFIVAIVNSEPITNGEVRIEAARLAQQLAQARRPQPSASELTRVVLERMISDKAQVQLAREMGLRVDEAMVDQAELGVAQQNRINVQELRRRLVADGLTVAQFRSQLRDQLLLSRVREREVDARVRVTDAEVDQFMRDEQQSNSAAPQEINVAQILVAVPESATPEQVTALQTKAQAVLARARANEDFGKLAREMSDAPDRATSGQMGLRAPDRLPPLFSEATKNLNEGAVTEVLRSGAGFHILKVIEKRAPGAVMITQNRARHILLRSTAQMNEVQAREKLTDIRRRVQAGQADFATLARENSQDGSAAQGGDLGWASPGQFVPEFEAVIDSLQPNQISEPFVSRFGMHVIELQERRTVPLGLKEQREVIRSQLREKKLDTAYAAWAQDVRGRAYVEMREPPLQ
jgi:peptidyl-prolyl cis-trans isomerase SurA